jgi:hypothetical protein
MLLMLRPLFLLIALLWATARATRTQAPLPLRLYLVAELITTVTLELAAWLYGWRSPIYTLIFILIRPWQLIAALNLARPSIVAGLITSMCTYIVYLSASLNLNGAIALTQGGLLLLAGISLGFRVPFETANKLTYGTLTALWLFLALFDFGFAMGLDLPAWGRLNEWWGALLCCVAFTIIGYLARTPSKQPQVPLQQIDT